MFLSTIIVSETITAGLYGSNGQSSYYFKEYTFNVPSSYKLTGKGFDSSSKLNYMNFKKGNDYVKVSIDKYSTKFNKKIMDGYTYFTWNGQSLYKTSISGVTGFYNEQNGAKTFVFSSGSDVIYLQTKGVDISYVISGITQKDYLSNTQDEYDYDDNLDYESDAYDDSFDDSFDDGSYYNYNW